MGFHIVGSCRPLSKFMVPLLILMWMASVVLLCQYPECHRILAEKNNRGHPHQDEQGDHELGQRPTATNYVKFT